MSSQAVGAQPGIGGSVIRMQVTLYWSATRELWPGSVRLLIDRAGTGSTLRASDETEMHPRKRSSKGDNQNILVRQVCSNVGLQQWVMPLLKSLHV